MPHKLHDGKFFQVIPKSSRQRLSEAKRHGAINQFSGRKIVSDYLLPRPLLAARTQDMGQGCLWEGIQTESQTLTASGRVCSCTARPHRSRSTGGAARRCGRRRGCRASCRRIMRGTTKERIAPIGKGVDEPALRRRNRAIVRKLIEQAEGCRGAYRGNGQSSNSATTSSTARDRLRNPQRPLGLSQQFGWSARPRL
jgi:hypothetical protein